MRSLKVRALFRQFGRAARRVFPACVTLGQAVAFNMFLAFFPMLLIALGLLDSTNLFQGAVQELQNRLVDILPAGSERVVSDYLVRRSGHAFEWILLGVGGTLLAGSQFVVLLMEGFRILERKPKRASWLEERLRAVAILCMMSAPCVSVVVLSVFGRQLRGWMVRHLGLRTFFRHIAALIYISTVLTLTLGVLMILYRLGRPGRRGWKHVVPGAAVATVLWWLVDVSFGTYVRFIPYSVVYGGLAAAIGLLLWMYLTAMVLFLGAAYVAEDASRP